MKESATNEKTNSQQYYTTTTETKKEIKPTEIVSPKKTYAESDLIAFLRSVSVKYGLEYEKMYMTILGESTFIPTKIGPGGLSVGIAQYTLSTWLSNCSNKDDRTDPYKSLECMGRMWSQGNQYQWDRYCDLYYDLKCINLRGLYPGFLEK